MLMKAEGRRSKSITGRMYGLEGIVPLVVTRGVFFLAEPSVNKMALCLYAIHIFIIFITLFLLHPSVKTCCKEISLNTLTIDSRVSADVSLGWCLLL